MKKQIEIQTAWELWTLINRLNDLLWERYEDDFADIDDIDLPETDDPCLGPLGPLGSRDTRDKPEG